MDRQREACLLDIEFFKPRFCDGVPSVVELTWKLWNANGVAADSTSEQTWRGFTSRNDGNTPGD